MHGREFGDNEDGDSKGVEEEHWLFVVGRVGGNQVPEDLIL